MQMHKGTLADIFSFVDYYGYVSGYGGGYGAGYGSGYGSGYGYGYGADYGDEYGSGISYGSDKKLKPTNALTVLEP